MDAVHHKRRKRHNPKHNQLLLNSRLNRLNRSVNSVESSVQPARRKLNVRRDQYGNNSRKAKESQHQHDHNNNSRNNSGA